MTDPQVLFERLSQSNPVPDESTLHAGRPHVDDALLAVRDEIRFLTARSSTWVRLRTGWQVAMVSFLIVVGLAVPLIWLAQDGGTDPVPPADPNKVIQEDALAAVRQWFDAIAVGDIDTVMDLSRPSAITESDRRLAEWLASFAAHGMPIQVKSCEVRQVIADIVLVDCRVALRDRVAIEVGIADLVAPFHYQGGLVVWQPYEGGDVGLVNDAYSTYLRMFHPTEYETVCSPAAYEPGSVVQDQMLALTGACADLVAPLSDDVAEWIRQGRPGPETGTP